MNLRDQGDPVELAQKYYEQGADEITFLDVKATVDNRSTMFDVVARTADAVSSLSPLVGVCEAWKMCPNYLRAVQTK